MMKYAATNYYCKISIMINVLKDEYKDKRAKKNVESSLFRSIALDK